MTACHHLSWWREDQKGEVASLRCQIKILPISVILLLSKSFLSQINKLIQTTWCQQDPFMKEKKRIKDLVKNIIKSNINNVIHYVKIIFLQLSDH